MIPIYFPTRIEYTRAMNFPCRLALASIVLTNPLYAAPDGDGAAEISGELKAWHAVTLTIDGPFAEETGKGLNPFTDIALSVVFRHESGEPEYRVPGYFAADGNAAETGADSGTKWRAHLSPDKTGKWTYETSLTKTGSGEALPGDGAKGEFSIEASDKELPDFRARGRLQYVGGHHLRFAGDGTYFLKAGPDAPETLLGYSDFDGTVANNPKKCPLKTWEPHLADWREGDPTWQDGKGKGLIGALNYLADQGLNGFSFLTYNAGGDGDNVWPFVERDEPLRYDCSKLDQWGIVFAHGASRGLHLHFKLQETENDDRRKGHKSEDGDVPTALDGGAFGPERQLYLREMVARYAHLPALNWNLGEENTQTPDEQRAMATFLRETDPYGHNIVIHSYPDQQDKVYPALLGDRSELTGASLQNMWNQVHQRTLQWRKASAEAGKPWVVANDEQGPAGLGVPPDPGFEGFDGVAKDPKAKGNSKGYDWTDVRRETLWGNLMAGGAGVEYYFGYQLPENDLKCEDFRSREKSWDACRIALEFFHETGVPFWEMNSDDSLVGNAEGKSGEPWCLANPGEVYVVFVPAKEKEAKLALPADAPALKVRRFFPDTGEWPELDEAFSSTTSGAEQIVLPTPEERDVVFLIGG